MFVTAEAGCGNYFKELIIWTIRNSGKSGLVHDLMAKGFTARKSEEAVNAVFDSMRRTLARGETVEVPGGSLRAQIRNGKPYKQHFKKRRNINTGKPFYPRVVSYPGRRRVVKFDPDLNLNLDHCAEYPPPTIPASVSFPAVRELRSRTSRSLETGGRVAARSRGHGHHGSVAGERGAVFGPAGGTAAHVAPPPGERLPVSYSRSAGKRSG
jgi:nucleoid DNA-binding protein